MSGSVSLRCPECGAPVPEGGSCADHFHELLTLEWCLPGGPDPLAHFYAVSSYNLQHPIRMGLREDALEGLRAAVADVLGGTITLEEVGRLGRRAAQAAGRVTRRDGDRVVVWGVTDWPITVKDVCEGGSVDYAVRVERWARSVQELLPARKR
jgi:hypothetical protein